MSIHIFDDNSIKKLAEDAAYTFKGLHKTADYYEISSKGYLTIPILFSIINLGFDAYLNTVVLKILAIISLFATTLVLFNQKKYPLIEEYRKLANQFKEQYDLLEIMFNNRDHNSEINEPRNTIATLNQKTTKLPVSLLGRLWSRRVIKKEMNLKWLE